MAPCNGKPSPQTAGLRTNEYVLLHSVQDGGYIAQVEHSKLICLCSLLVPPDTHVADPGSNNPLVDVGLSACLETTFGLEKKRVRRLFGARGGNNGVKLTGVPQGETGCLLPFDLPRPPP